jgi:anti-anti-sigma factor
MMSWEEGSRMSSITAPGARADRASVTISVPGRFDGSTVGLVRQALHAVIGESDADVTIELASDWIDMPALAMLAHAHRQLRAQHRRLVVCAASVRVRRVLAVTGLNRVIPVQSHATHLVA